MRIAKNSVDTKRKQQELAESKKMMQQAYYIAAARKDKYNQKNIAENLNYHFGLEM